jgi:broad specificity phosphatase PhoE
MHIKLISNTQEIIVVRHGESTQNIHARQKLLFPKLINILYRICGANTALLATMLIDLLRGKKTYSEIPDAEVELSAQGEFAAKLTGQNLLAHQLIPDLIISSSFVRARQTAEILRAELENQGYSVPLIAVPFLQERNEGILDGLPRDYIKHLLPEEAMKYEVQGKFFYRPQGGEEILDVFLRVRGSFWKTLAAHPEKKIMIVAHGITNLCLHSLLTREDLHTNLEQSWQVMPNLAITRYTLGNSGDWQNDPQYTKRTIF